MRLHELLDRVASADEPPARADDGATIYAAAVRRRTVVRFAQGGVAVVAAAAVVAVTLVVVPSGGTPEPAASSASPTGEPVRPVQPPPFTYNGSLAGNGQHLYVTTNPSATSGPQLWGSDDGGRTWTVRREQIAGINATLVAPSGAVISDGFSDPPPGHPEISRDGGRTATQARPVDSIEGSTDPDRVVWCGVLPGQAPSEPARPSSRPCELITADLKAGTYGRLRTGPAIDVNRLETGPDGVLWVGGSVVRDGVRVLAVARSDDGGRGWAVHEFAGTAVTEDAVWPRVMVGVDGTVVADFVYRSAGAFKRYVTRLDGEAWKVLDGKPTEDAFADNFGGRANPPAYVDADGRNVQFVYESGTDGTVTLTIWEVRRGETTYRQIDRPAGLPQAGGGADELVTFIPGLGYIANGNDGLHFSADAKTWRRLKIG